jgi:hypothetical protein
MVDIAEWISTLIIGVVGIGIAIIISQKICEIEPTTCSVYPPIIGAAVFGLALVLKFGLSKR